MILFRLHKFQNRYNKKTIGAPRRITTLKISDKITGNVLSEITKITSEEGDKIDIEFLASPKGEIKEQNIYERVSIEEHLGGFLNWNTWKIFVPWGLLLIIIVSFLVIKRQTLFNPKAANKLEKKIGKWFKS